MRRQIHVEKRLDAPPEAVFEILADHGRYDRFDGIRRAEVVKPGDPAPNGLGAVRRIWIGPLRFQEEITAYEPPARLDYLIVDLRGVPFRHEGGSIRLSPSGGGTDVLWTSSFEIPIPLVGSALDWAFKQRLERGFRQVLERSVELATQQPPAPA
jgi:uncharacterized protein YndB with AHSA1/START domain